MILRWMYHLNPSQPWRAVSTTTTHWIVTAEFLAFFSFKSLANIPMCPHIPPIRLSLTKFPKIDAYAFAPTVTLNSSSHRSRARQRHVYGRTSRELDVSSTSGFQTAIIEELRCAVLALCRLTSAVPHGPVLPAGSCRHVHPLSIRIHICSDVIVVTSLHSVPHSNCSFPPSTFMPIDLYIASGCNL